MSLIAIPPLCLANRKRKFECWRVAAINTRSTKQQRLDDNEESKVAEIDKTIARLFITSLAAISKKLNHASTTLRCITKDLDPIPSCTEILSLRQQNTERLLRDRKLVLVLDLDNTLLHTVDYKTLTLNEEISLKFDHRSDAFEWGAGGNSVTKLRPHVRTFLKEASKMYDMYIYTMGSRAYARQMAKFLDPDGVYFASKVISREDCTRRRKKGLDVVLGEERVAVIIDDKEHVWRKSHRKNVLVIDKYCFFGDGRRYYQEIALMMKLHQLESIHQFFFSDETSLERGDVRDVIRGMISNIN